MIRAPSSISRTSREIKYVKKWKASEWRMFLIFYGLLCFDGLLPQKYFVHFALLSKSFFLLLQKSIPLTNLDVVNQLLRQFVFLNQQHYGLASMLYNVHLLLHVVAGVRDWGPVWGANTFIFEGENRHLGQMNTSSGHVGIQVTRRYLLLAEFPKYVEQYATTYRPLNFVQKIMGKSYQHFVRCGQCVLSGPSGAVLLNDELIQCLRNSGIICGENVLSFKKCLYDKIRYTTKQYCEGKKFDDSWIKTNTGIRGSIEMILKINCEERDVTVFVLKEALVEREPVLIDPLVTVTHLKKVERRGGLTAVLPSAVVSQCIYFNLDKGNFICDIPYGCYGD